MSSCQSDRLTADTTELEADLATVRLQYGYRIGEYQAISLGLALHGVDLTTGTLVSDQLFDWVRNNGNPVAQGTVASTDFWVAEFLLRWRRDTRNRQIFPDRGAEQSLTFRTAVPGSEVEYYAIDYELTKFWPLDGRWTARFGAKLGFGGEYGSKTSSLPPYLNWFAGGPRSVRGYRENRLGPRDSLANPYGGNLFLTFGGSHARERPNLGERELSPLHRVAELGQRGEGPSGAPEPLRVEARLSIGGLFKRDESCSENA